MDSELILSNSVTALCTGLSIVAGYYFYLLLCCMAQKRQGILWTILVFFSCVILSYMIIYPRDMYNITLDLIWFTVMMLVCFQGKIIMKLSITALLYPLIISKNFLLNDILLQIFILCGESFALNLFLTLADNVVHMLFWYFIYRAFRERVKNIAALFDAKTWFLLFIVCFASMVSITTSIYFAPAESYKMWPAALASFLTNIGCFYLSGYFVTNIQRDMLQQNLKLQQDYYEELEKNQTEIRRLRHDMNNHLSVIKGLFQADDRENVLKYLETLESQMTAANRVFCKNSIVNAVLNVKYNLAQASKTDCFFHIELDHVLGIDAVSLCCIFANTLDNAIEASLKIPEPQKRRISVKARVTQSGYFSYEISNAKSNPVKRHRDKFVSDKEDKKSHGLGLSSVRRIVDQFNGMMDISYTEDTFTVVILIGNAA